MSARMETRPPNIEGKGEIRQRELVKNALRMRPDRIILGECRGEEAFDMLQAMNTGHEGSMATIHANNPRDAISRLEQMIGMAGLPMTDRLDPRPDRRRHPPDRAASRLSDGKRKVTSIAEITGMEGDIVQMQEIFKFVRTGTAAGRHAWRAISRPPACARASSPILQRAASRSPAAISIPAAAVSPHAVRARSDLSDLSVRGAVCGGCSSKASICCSSPRARIARTSTAVCKLLEDQPNRENMLMQLRRERGLSTAGDYRLPLIALNRLVLQSGLTLGIGKFAISSRSSPLFAFGLMMATRGDLLEAFGAALVCGTLLPCWCCSSCAAGGRRRSAPSFPTRWTSSCAACAPAIRCRSRSPWWRARCPIRSAASSASSPTRSPTAPISKPRMRNLYFRIGQDDLPLFVTAVAIQGSTGGNLGEILENLSARHSPAFQDAAQDQRAGGGRPRLGDDPVVAADRDVSGRSRSSRRTSTAASGTRA